MSQNKTKYNKAYFFVAFVIVVAVLAAISHLFGLGYQGKKPVADSLRSDTEVTDIDSIQPVADNLTIEDTTALPLPDSVSFNPVDSSMTLNADGADSIDLFAHSKVWSYPECFPDSNYLQMEAAMKNGVRPMADSRSLTQTVKKGKLTNISSSPFYVLDDLTHSQPYLVPKAQTLLNAIGINFLDSLQHKGLRLHIPIVSSVLRTDENIVDLQKQNRNSITNSCHQYGTTIDITYNRFYDIENGSQTCFDDRLKKALAEVLFDLRAEGRCYVRYEHRQACFHLTVR